MVWLDVVKVPGVHVPAAVVAYPALPLLVVWGAVQPVGTATVTAEPVPNPALAGAVKVKDMLLPVDPATTVVGDTVIVPLPLVAAACTVSVPLPTEVPLPPPLQLLFEYLVAVNVMVYEPAVTLEVVDTSALLNVYVPLTSGTHPSPLSTNVAPAGRPLPLAALSSA